ncbi:MAG: enoyl-ACP reductase [Armatimonadota bacterium]|nr:enoyl-ACP reductase [bacterium]MCS7309734.1 enoyl-ACP reductase [Armatimonadota bacterium]MDW8104252.1 enoyl-ACP reductase [Armatimonadota bacterium]MDW8289789.1 enoyl-ACP reductase [Armatimonadota bacterium]
MAGLVEGKRALVLGVASERSIAWAIAQRLAQEGATLALTYQNERLERNVRSLAERLPGTWLLPCDVSDDEQISRLSQELQSRWERLDILVHSVAFAKKEELSGRYVDTSREGFRLAMDVSVFSLVALCKALEPMMGAGSSVLTLTYLGSERVVPNYNVMGVAKAALEASVRYLSNDLGPQGIRVNAISAGPVNTLAARAIAGFTTMLQRVREVAPLRRNTEAEEVADAALFLLSDLARGVTGEVLYVDSGYHILGMV